MSFETLILERGDGYAVVTLNRPPANTISTQLVVELEAAVDELARDDGVRAVVLTGAGDRIFCGGADLSGAFGGGVDELEAFLRRGQTLLRRIERLSKPVIAAIQGHATGGGCEIAMACHLRVMKETARIGQTESNLGIIPGFGGTQRLPRLIGRTKALELLILGIIEQSLQASVSPRRCNPSNLTRNAACASRLRASPWAPERRGGAFGNESFGLS